MSSSPATAHDETVTFLEAGAETILAVATNPTAEPLGVGVVVLPGGGAPLTTGRNRFAVRLCRDLASSGFHTIRLDYHGAGESTGSISRLRLDQPFVEDTEAAIRFLRLQGIDRIIIIGSCFGARTALATAASSPEVIAVALVSCPVRDFEMGQQTAVLAAERRSVWAYLARGLRPHSLRQLTKREVRSTYWRHAKAKVRHIRASRSPGDPGGRNHAGVSARFLGQIQDLAARAAPVYLIYGNEEYLYDDFQRAQRGALGDLLASMEARATITVLDGAVHAFTNVKLQDAVRDLIVAWTRRTAASGIDDRKDEGSSFPNAVRSESGR